jgi:hypothetical protein
MTLVQRERATVREEVSVPPRPPVRARVRSRALAMAGAILAGVVVGGLAFWGDFGQERRGPTGRARLTAARPIEIHGATAAEERAVDWALHRYREAGLTHLPPLEVFLHRNHDACSGGIGVYYSGRIDLCTKASSEPYERKFALHEIAHAWAETNVSARTRERFMDVRGIASWNDRADPWKERGTEQSAEIITWGLGEGEIAPLLPTPVDAETLASLYELLTGGAPITPGAAG